MSVENDFFEDGDGRRFFLGKLPPRPNFGGFPSFAESVPLVPRSEWKDVNRRQLFGDAAAGWILNQGQKSSCVGQGGVNGLRKARVLAGKSDVMLSPAFAYSLINHNRDAGAIISDCLHALKDVGTCPFALVGQDPIFLRHMPGDAAKQAKRFQISEAFHARTFDEIASGIQRGYIAVYGIMVGPAFNHLDPHGVAGHTPGPGNHCMHADGMRRLPDGRWVLDNVNSWGESWGQHGRCYLDERHFQGIDPDCFMIRAAQEDPEDLPPVAQ